MSWVKIWTRSTSAGCGSVLAGQRYGKMKHEVLQVNIQKNPGVRDSAAVINLSAVCQQGAVQSHQSFAWTNSHIIYTCSDSAADCTGPNLVTIGSE